MFWMKVLGPSCSVPLRSRQSSEHCPLPGTDAEGVVCPQDRAGTASGNGDPRETVGQSAVRAELLQGPRVLP